MASAPMLPAQPAEHQYWTITVETGATDPGIVLENDELRAADTSRLPAADD